MPLLLDRLLGRRKKSRHTTGDTGPRFFQNASHPEFRGAVSMIGQSISNNDQSITVINKSSTIENINYIDQGKPVLEALAREMAPGADIDSSARHPPPKCYPGTRKSLTAKARNWLHDDQRTWDILWLHGPAGVGKSAVAQTLAEYAAEQNRLGAAFFFSKTAGRNNPQSVFITLAYQLAVRIPQYLPHIARQLARDPDLLNKAPPIQFKRLIIEPLSALPSHPKYLVILDGLDECNGQQAQLDIVELINNLILSQTSIPIIWMICSRPEPHLMLTLSRPDFVIQCWREELAVDTEESRDDNARFIRARFREIHESYRDCVVETSDGSWPSENEIMRIIEEASGLFIFAITILKYIEDPEFGQPNTRLVDVLGAIGRSHVFGQRSPMEGLDDLYMRILSEVPDEIWPVTYRLLKLIVYDSAISPHTPLLLSNLLGITRSDFYTALRKLHSILDIPSPSDAAEWPLRFYHASFGDFLAQPARSGRYCVMLPPYFRRTGEAQKLSLRVIGSAVTFFASCTGAFTNSLPNPEHPIPRMTEFHASQMLSKHLTWTLSDPYSNLEVARDLVEYATGHIFSVRWLHAGDGYHEELIHLLRVFDYNSLCFLRTATILAWMYRIIPYFIHWSLTVPSLRDLVRTRSTSKSDGLLIESAGSSAKPLDLNWISAGHYFEDLPKQTEEVYFFMGYGSNAVFALVKRKYSLVRFRSVKPTTEIWPELTELLLKPNNADTELCGEGKCVPVG